MDNAKFESDVAAVLTLSQQLITKLEDDIKELIEANQHLKDTVKRLSHSDAGTGSS